MRVKYCTPPLLCLLTALVSPATAQETAVLPGTQPLTMQGDLSVQMVAGIDKFLLRETERSADERKKFWNPDFSSIEAYEKSTQPHRERLRKIIGAVDTRLPASAFEIQTNSANQPLVAETDAFTVKAVRWPVFDGVFGEGLWLQPKREVVAHILAIPDADQTPEMLAGLTTGLAPERQFARRLAENGCEVIVPVLINRDDTWSGNEKLHRFTNLPHREWIYRQAYELGRHIIGYEVQKILAAVDCLQHESPVASRSAFHIGIAGYGEGGLIAFYSAALDPRIEATLVSGYFAPRQRLWEEPIYRNVFGLLQEFGDAEIASLVAPRAFIVEHSEWPKVSGPPIPRAGRNGAAPGLLVTPDRIAVETELNRA